MVRGLASAVRAGHLRASLLVCVHLRFPLLCRGRQRRGNDEGMPGRHKAPRYPVVRGSIPSQEGEIGTPSRRVRQSHAECVPHCDALARQAAIDGGMVAPWMVPAVPPSTLGRGSIPSQEAWAETTPQWTRQPVRNHPQCGGLGTPTASGVGMVARLGGEAETVLGVGIGTDDHRAMHGGKPGWRAGPRRRRRGGRR